MSLNGHDAISEALEARDYSTAIRAVRKVADGADARAEECHELCRAISRDVGHDKGDRGVATGLYALLRQPQSVRVSLHEHDEHALGRMIENVDAKHTGNFEGLKPVVGRLELAIGAEPDRVLGIKGSGIRGQLAQLRWLVVVALVAGQALPKLWELAVKWIL